MRLATTKAEYNHSRYIQDRRDHWWNGKRLEDALRLLWDAARARDGLDPDGVRGVLLTYRPEAAACALRRAIGWGHLIECRRHGADGGVTTIYHAIGRRP